MSYRLGGDWPISEVPSGTNLMISGPPMTGKYELMHEILTLDEDNVVVISTNDPERKIAIDYESIDSQQFGIIDCVSKYQGLDADDSENRKFIASPKNLTRIGVAFTDFYSKWEQEPTRVGLDSLSNLLMYSDLKHVYKFIQVMTGQIFNAKWISVMTYDHSMHDEQTNHTLQDPFDGLIETREDNGSREFRIRGLEPGSTEWITF